MTTKLTSSAPEWLLEAIEQEQRREAGLLQFEDDSRALINRTVDTKNALALFGLLLGALPPAAIYLRFIVGPPHLTDNPLVVTILCISILVCALTGRWFASLFDSCFDARKNTGALDRVGSAMIWGLLWGIVTGGLGGLVVFGFGAIPGAMIAAVVGFLAFPIFMLLYNWISWGGMIESRQLWPFALGIPAFVAATILGI